MSFPSGDPQCAKTITSLRLRPFLLHTLWRRKRSRRELQNRTFRTEFMPSITHGIPTLQLSYYVYGRERRQPSGSDRRECSRVRGSPAKKLSRYRGQIPKNHVVYAGQMCLLWWCSFSGPIRISFGWETTFVSVPYVRRSRLNRFECQQKTPVVFA